MNCAQDFHGATERKDMDMRDFIVMAWALTVALEATFVLLGNVAAIAEASDQAPG